MQHTVSLIPFNSDAQLHSNFCCHSIHAQIKDVGEWLPINLKYAALVHFVRMLDSPEVCTYIIK